jgi:hypothetical protein
MTTKIYHKLPLFGRVSFVLVVQKADGQKALHLVLAIPQGKSDENFSSIHWIGLFGKILTGNHGFYHQI